MASALTLFGEFSLLPDPNLHHRQAVCESPLCEWKLLETDDAYVKGPLT